MKPIQDIFYVSADKDANRTIQHGGLKLWTNPEFEPEKNAVITGTIYQAPSKYSLYNYVGHKIEARKDVDLAEGTKVYFHHFTVTEQSRESYFKDKELYRCNYANIYCAIKDGKIQMLEHWLLVTPIMEDESKVKKQIGDTTLWLKAQADKISLHGIVEEISPYYERLGIKKKDRIIFTRSSEYEMKIEGKDYYRMAMQDVIGVIDGNTIIPTKGTVIVRQHTPEQKKVKGIILLEKTVEKVEKVTCTQVVFSGCDSISPGENVYYEKGRVQRFEFNGALYSMIREEEIALVQQ